MDRWIGAVLGLPVGPPGTTGMTASGRPVRLAAAPPPPPPPRDFVEELATRPRSGAVIAPPIPFGPVTECRGAKGRTLKVTRGENGRVAFTAPRPPVEEITFAGGGGKGAALPGAVQALHESGVLAGTRVVNGASVGSMSASLVAVGATAEEFAETANHPLLAAKIKEGHSMAGIMFGGGLTGEGLEKVARDETARVVRKRVAEYRAKGGADAKVLAIDARLAGGAGVTFGDLRELHRHIPEVKEVTISATMMGDDAAAPGSVAKGKPQLVIFSADTEPALEIAVATRASASLPPVFKQVDIKLSSGITGRFQDGGVLNNNPDSATVGAQRQVDPMPQSGSMTFIFEGDEAEQVLAASPKATRNRLNDLISQGGEFRRGL